MSAEDFYVTLPSNSSLSYYPDNTIANYRTKLPRPIHINSPYEVALTEIHYPLSWPQYSKEDAWIRERYRNRNGHLQVPILVMSTGRFDSLTELTEEITRRFKKLKEPEPHPIISYNRITNRVLVQASYPTEIMFKGGLARMLGFKPNVYSQIGTISPLEAPLPADSQAGVYSMYVYSDVVQHQTVGDHYVPLMRVVQIEDAPKKFVTTVFTRPHYLRVSKNHLDTIEVAVKNDQNENIPFTYGKVIVVLHFRPVKYS